MKKTGLRFLKYALAGVLLLPSLTSLAFAEETGPSASPESETEGQSVADKDDRTRSRIKEILAGDQMDCTLQFSLPQFTGEETERNELFNKLQVDVYKVAGLTQYTGYDTYYYAPVIEKSDANVAKIDSYDELKDVDNTTWDEIAKVFAASTSLESTKAGTGTATDGEIVIKNLKPGLYLVVPHDAENSTKKTKEGYSVAYTTLYEYDFKPQLISIPSPSDLKGTSWKIDDSIESFVMTPSMMTSDAAAEGWLTTVEVMLKPQRTRRFASLKIVKAIDTYELGQPVTFVFSIDEINPKEGETGYHNVTSITFDDTLTSETNSTIVEHIPYGIDVLVKEIYAGANYSLNDGETGERTVKVEVAADQTTEPGKEPVITVSTISNKRKNDNRKGWGLKNIATFKDGKWTMVSEKDLIEDVEQEVTE